MLKTLSFYLRRPAQLLSYLNGPATRPLTEYRIPNTEYRLLLTAPRPPVDS